MQDLTQMVQTPVRPLPKLNTGHCIVRLADPSEAPAVVKYLSANKDHLANAGPVWPDDYLTESYWVNQLNKNIEDFHAETAVRFFIFERSSPDTVIGAANINNIVKGAFYSGALGYGIAKDKEGKKIMKEALQSVITYGFSAFNLHRIMANYQPTNDRSGQLLRSLGFSVEGYARDYLIINGKWCDHILTSIINPNWVKP